MEIIKLEGDASIGMHASDFGGDLKSAEFARLELMKRKPEPAPKPALNRQQRRRKASRPSSILPRDRSSAGTTSTSR